MFITCAAELGCYLLVWETLEEVQVWEVEGGHEESLEYTELEVP